jgi:acetyltransferase-like isoleucine patch superfamily enzyme
MRSIRFGSIGSILLVNLLLRFATFKFFGITIGHGSWIKSKCKIGIGSGIGWKFTVRGSGELSIGNFCAIGEHVRVITSNHSTDYMALNFALQSKVIGTRLTGEKVDVRVGNDVWIGDGAIILPGVSIGDGAVIGAGSVVTKSVGAFVIAAGNPARVIRHRFSPETVAEIRKTAWWDWTIDEMKNKKELFQRRLS